MDSKPFKAAHELMPCASKPATWSAIKATSGEITTVKAPVFLVPGQGRDLIAERLASARRQAPLEHAHPLMAASTMTACKDLPSAVCGLRAEILQSQTSVAVARVGCAARCTSYTRS